MESQNQELTKREKYLNDIITGKKKKIKCLEDNRNLVFEKKCNDVFSTIFSPTQIKLMINKKKRVAKWTNDDISSAISLRSISPKAYRFLLKMHYPLPGK